MTFQLFKRRRIWHYRFQVKPFKRVQRSTRDRSEVRASALAQRAYDDAVLHSNGGNPPQTLAELVADWKTLRAPAVSRSYVKSVETLERCHL